MNRSLKLSILLLLIVLIAAAAEYYKLANVRRVDSDLYRSGDIYIQTQYCYHYTYGEDALLKWEGPYAGNTIIWADNTTCGVKKVWK
jgi:hypothetical protein